MRKTGRQTHKHDRRQKKQQGGEKHKLHKKISEGHSNKKVKQRGENKRAVRMAEQAHKEAERKILKNYVCETSCESNVAFVSFLWSITVKPGPGGDRSQWTTMAVVGFYSFLVLSTSVYVCVVCPCMISYATCSSIKFYPGKTRMWLKYTTVEFFLSFFLSVFNDK